MSTWPTFSPNPTSLRDTGESKSPFEAIKPWITIIYVNSPSDDISFFLNLIFYNSQNQQHSRWYISCHKLLFLTNLKVDTLLPRYITLDIEYGLLYFSFTLLPEIILWNSYLIWQEHNIQPDPPENCQLTVKKLPKTWFFF